MISCLIHTRNSATYLREVLRSVAWCDEVVVIDMESSDETISIAREMGARVEPHPFVGFADPARAFGLTKAKGDWILSIDSDEIVPATLATRLRRVAENNEADVVDLCFRNFFFGSELRGTGWSWKNIVVTRFFRKGYVSYGDKVHDFIRVKAESRRLGLVQKDLAIIHFNYSDVRHFIEKLNRYTDLEAVKQPPGSTLPALLYQALREIGGRFFILGGWKDGWLGLYLSFGMAFYRMSTIAKQKTGSRAEIENGYIQLARQTPVGARRQ